MKRTLFVYAISVTAALTFCRTAAQAQTASFLNVNPDPISMSLAGTEAVLEANAFSIWNNTAATALGGERFQVGAAYSLWQPSFSSNSNIGVAGYGKVAKFMTVSAGFKYFSYQPYEISGTEPGMVSGTFTPFEPARIDMTSLPGGMYRVTLSYTAPDGTARSVSADIAKL